MYYLTDPENIDVIIKTNSKQLVENLVGRGYVLAPAWRKKVIIFFKDWLALAIAILVSTLMLDYTKWSCFWTAITVGIGAILYNWLKERFVQ